MARLTIKQLVIDLMCLFGRITTSTSKFPRNATKNIGRYKEINTIVAGSVWRKKADLNSSMTPCTSWCDRLLLKWVSSNCPEFSRGWEPDMLVGWLGGMVWKVALTSIMAYSNAWGSTSVPELLCMWFQRWTLFVWHQHWRCCTYRRWWGPPLPALQASHEPATDACLACQQARAQDAVH